MSSAVWLSWENHRRSREISRALNVPFHVLRGPEAPLLYPAVPLLKSLLFLLRTRNSVVVVQNPSLLLTAIACALKPLKKFRVIQDLHSYFAQHIHRGVGFRGKVYRLFSIYCIRRADLTIVTNAELKNVVEKLGGRAIILQDAIPIFAGFEDDPAREGRSVVFVCTFSSDEPVESVISAARMLTSDTDIYFTGRIPRRLKTWTLPANVHLTGFLPERKYLALLNRADAVMALTSRDHTLLCGAYEGLAFRKPLILSDKPALRSYFGDDVIYVKNDPVSIAEGIRRLYSAKPFFDRHAEDLVRSLNRDWSARFSGLRAAVEPQEALR